MELIAAKILVLTLLGTLRLFFGLLPLKVTKYLEQWGEKSNRRLQVDYVISVCLCFGGGVLLATCFIHMIPEVRESLDAVRQNGGLRFLDASFPAAELLICSGFFLVFVLEEAAHYFFLRFHNKELGSFHKGDPPSEGETTAQNGNCSEVLPWSGRSAKIMPTQSQAHLLAPALATGPMLSSPPHQQGKHGLTVVQMNSSDSETSITPDQEAHVENHSSIPESNNGPIVKPANHHQHICLESSTEGTLLDNLRNFIVVLALSFHSVFEGMAIGLQPTQTDVWYLFTAVSIHAAAIVFCIGLELVTSGAKRQNIITYMVVLALVSPAGVVIGILVTLRSSMGSVTQILLVGVLQGLAGGTILYITFFEVLDRERKRQTGCGAVRITSIILGFCLMVALQIVAGHSHSTGEVHKTFSPWNSTKH